MPTTLVDGCNIYYDEIGKGQPLVLIMGLGADSSAWEEHYNAYKEHFRCILIDNRGAGRSDKPDGSYTTKQMAKDTVGVMDALGIDKAHISGISMGGAIAQEIGIGYPERVRTLTLISTWAKCNVYMTRIFEMFKEVNGVIDGDAFTRMLQLWIFPPQYHEDNFDDLLSREASGRQNPYPMPRQAFLSQCDACITHDTVGKLGSIKVPTLVTVGDRDIFTPYENSRYIADSIAGSEHEVLEGGGHTHHWEQLSKFNEKTLKFLLENK